MLYQPRITNAAKRTTLVLVFMCIFATQILATADNSNSITTSKVTNSEAKSAEMMPQQKPSSIPTAAVIHALIENSDQLKCGVESKA